VLTGLLLAQVDSLHTGHTFYRMANCDQGVDPTFHLDRCVHVNTSYRSFLCSSDALFGTSRYGNGGRAGYRSSPIFCLTEASTIRFAWELVPGCVAKVALVKVTAQMLVRTVIRGHRGHRACPKSCRSSDSRCEK
jgi:hypothetical protein